MSLFSFLNPKKPAASDAPASPTTPEPLPLDIDEAYAQAIESTCGMVREASAQREASAHGLKILNVTWEDAGRFKGSSVGPNISDMTIQVGRLDAQSRAFKVAAMPVIRFPNFSDKSADLSPRDFTLLVGNEKVARKQSAGEASPCEQSSELKRISLYDFLEGPRRFLSNPASWKGERQSLLAPRDEQVLVSAQACFLPVSRQGTATFNPVLFNYQSRRGDPAVLAVLATREGTSATIIDNTRDAFSSGSAWGQRLFHNLHGQRAPLTGERESEFRLKNQSTGPTPGVGSEARDQHEGGLNMVLLIQIPLKQKELRLDEMRGMMVGAASIPRPASIPRMRSDVENAVIGHGEVEGPFTEIDGLDIERDERFPIRVTVQFYKATSNGVLSPQDMSEIAEQINRVYAQSDYVGSLVTGGRTARATEYEGLKVQPPDWWEQFWQSHHAITGDTPEQAQAKLKSLLGDEWSEENTPVSELMLRDGLRA